MPVSFPASCMEKFWPGSYANTLSWIKYCVCHRWFRIPTGLKSYTITDKYEITAHVQQTWALSQIHSFLLAICCLKYMCLKSCNQFYRRDIWRELHWLTSNHQIISRWPSHLPHPPLNGHLFYWLMNNLSGTLRQAWKSSTSAFVITWHLCPSSLIHEGTYFGEGRWNLRPHETSPTHRLWRWHHFLCPQFNAPCSFGLSGNPVRYGMVLKAETRHKAGGH